MHAFLEAHTRCVWCCFHRACTRVGWATCDRRMSAVWSTLVHVISARASDPLCAPQGLINSVTRLCMYYPQKSKACYTGLMRLPTHANVLFPLTVIKNVTHVTCCMQGVPANRARAAAKAALETAGLRFAQHRRTDSLSGGMKRRLSVAIAMVNRRNHLNMPRFRVASTPYSCFVITWQVGDAAQLLVLDEPSTGLDPGARHQLWNMLRRLVVVGEENRCFVGRGSARSQQYLTCATTTRYSIPNLQS